MFMTLGLAEALNHPLPSPLKLHAQETRLFEAVAIRFVHFWFTRLPAVEFLPLGDYLTGCSHELQGFDPQAGKADGLPDWRGGFLEESRFEFSVVPE
jgi:hypothetical protein